MGYFRDRLILERLDALLAAMGRLETDNAALFTKVEVIMATLQDVQTATAAEDTVIDSAIVLLNGLAAQVAALTPNQAAIDALAADISAKTASLAAAVTANTPNPPAQPTVAVVDPTA
jgi:hypothetical protein